MNETNRNRSHAAKGAAGNRALAWALWALSASLAPGAAFALAEGGPDLASQSQGMQAAPADEAVMRSVANYDIPALTFTNADGEKVPLRAALDTGPVLVNFIFTSCGGICPALTATFAAVQRRLAADGKTVRMVSISIDPEYDTPARLAAYAKRYQAGPDWQFLTGSVADSLAVQRAFDAFRGDKMGHTPLILLRAGPGAPWVRFDGFASVSDLVGEVGKQMVGMRD